MKRFSLVLAAALTCVLPRVDAQGRPARAPRAATRSEARPPAARRPSRRARVSAATARLTVERASDNPFHARFTVAVEGPGTWEYVADHRVLSFEVTPAPPAEEAASGTRRRARRARRVRTWTCKHPNVIRKVDTAHVSRTPETFSEPIDLRMYCFGRAYDAIVAGGSVVPVYGFRRATRTAYLARALDDETQLPLASVRGEAFVPFPATPPAGEEGAEAGPPIEVGLVATDSTAPNAPVLRGFLRARRAVRLYMRDDLFSFRITDPSGRVSSCAPPRTVVVPIIDFWKRLSRGGRLEASTDTARHCQGIFREPGIYEVVPMLELPYSGERWQIDAVTGRFTGTPSFVRVRPQRGRYVVPRT